MKQEHKRIGFSSQEELEKAWAEYKEKPETKRFEYLQERRTNGTATREELKELEDRTWWSKTNARGCLRPENFPRPDFFPYKKLTDRIEDFAGDFVKRAWVHAASFGGPPEVSAYYEAQDGSFHVMPPEDPELNRITWKFWNTCEETDETSPMGDWGWYDMTFYLTESRYRDAFYSFYGPEFGRDSEYEDEEDWIRRNLGEVELIRH